MKYLAVLGLSALVLVGFFMRSILISGSIDSVIYKNNLKEGKKFQYKVLIITWAILTIAAFIFVAFFVE